jgi:hypothetical protein
MGVVVVDVGVEDAWCGEEVMVGTRLRDFCAGCYDVLTPLFLPPRGGPCELREEEEE